MERRLEQLDDPASELSQIWNRQHDQHVLRQLLALAEPHFAPNTWKAFCRVALDGAQADVVAKELDISLNAVFIAKSRVLNRLRQEAEGLVESSSGFFAKC
jgi:RNA polymerase sigma-70 factor (ECF subfamily)